MSNTTNTSSSLISILPPPQTFDIVPSLHALISRLLAPSTIDTAQSPLSPKDLATEASAIQTKIQKARQAVQNLPDIDRTIREQQEEVQVLEAKVERLKLSLRQIAANSSEGGRS